MKKMNLYIILILASFLLGACEKSGPMPPCSLEMKQDTIFEMIWATRMDFEKEIVNLANGASYNNWFLYSGDLGDPPTIMAFNKESGEKEWEYVHDGVIQDEIDVSYVFENIYLGMCSSGIVGIDLDKQKSLWEIDLQSMNLTRGVKFDRLGNKLYFRSVWALGNPGQSTRFYSLDPFTGKLEVVYQTNNGLLNPPLFYSENESKMNVIFNEYPWENDLPEESVQNLICIDLELGTEVWRNDSITQNFNSNIGQNAVLYDDRILITGGDWSIYAFNVQTGEELWRYEFDYPWAIWTKTNHVIHDDRLYVNNSQKDVTCLNPETGELIWNNPEGGPNCTENMVYFEKEDLLVFTSWGYGSVMVLDALTGETLHRERKYDESQYNNDVVYDEERDMFFTSSFKHAIGFKVNRQ